MSEALHPSEHAPSYYAATAGPIPERPPLQGHGDADVCIVSAGYTGLSTALHLAEAGLRVVVLEAARVGWGASGRNGGQIVHSYSLDIDFIEQRRGAASSCRTCPSRAGGCCACRWLRWGPGTTGCVIGWGCDRTPMA